MSFSFSVFSHTNAIDLALASMGTLPLMPETNDDDDHAKKSPVEKTAKKLAKLHDKIDDLVSDTLESIGKDKLADYVASLSEKEMVNNQILMIIGMVDKSGFSMVKSQYYADKKKPLDRQLTPEEAIKAFTGHLVHRTEDTPSTVMNGEQVKAAASADDGAYVPGSGNFPEAKVDSTTLEVHATFEEPGQGKFTQVVYSSDHPNASIEELQARLAGQAEQVVDAVINNVDPEDDTAMGHALRNASRGNASRGNARRNNNRNR